MAKEQSIQPAFPRAKVAFFSEYAHRTCQCRNTPAHRRPNIHERVLILLIKEKNRRVVTRPTIIFFTFVCMKLHRKIALLAAILIAGAFFPSVNAAESCADVSFSLGDSIHSDTLTDTAGRLNFRERRAARKERTKDRNFHFNILGGPSYSPDFGVLVGASALFTFRMRKEELTLKRSVLPINLAVSMGGVSVSTRPQLFFKSDRFRIFGQLSYKYNTDNYYGVGFDTNKNRTRGESTTEYMASTLTFNPYFLFRIKNSDFFVGPMIDIGYDFMKNPAAEILRDADYLAEGGNESGYRNFTSGLGLLVNYDTRDVPSNAYRGIFLEARGAFYNKFIGSNTNFYRFEIDYRQYISVGRRKVLSWTAQSKNVFGNAPITKLPFTGSPYDLRGYYMGQFRDKTSHVVVAEYRQMFNSSKDNLIGKIIRHLGWAAWAGCGFMGDSPAKINGVLPNVGIGLRIEVQPRMNIRFDYGRDFINKQGLFYFNMTEAF